VKFISAFFLSVAFLLFSFKPFIPFINYAINKQYIIREFCVNKDKPEMHCNGKCYLEKQIKELYNQQPEPEGDHKDIPKNIHEQDNYLMFSLCDIYRKDYTLFVFSIHSQCLKSIYYLSPPDPPPRSII